MKGSISKALACTGLALLLSCGCGGKKAGDDADVGDTSQDDIVADTATDSSTDLPPDTEPDGVPDVFTDSEPDAVPDVEPDADLDSSLDTAGDEVGDPYGDWPTDLPSDWPYETASECEAAGGFCSGARWELCPVGYEYTGTGDGRLGCDVGGWCCVPAPPSTCSASGWTNCVEGSACVGCWDDPGDPLLACEEGRVCCYDVCD